LGGPEIPCEVANPPRLLGHAFAVTPRDAKVDELHRDLFEVPRETTAPLERQIRISDAPVPDESDVFGLNVAMAVADPVHKLEPLKDLLRDAKHAPRRRVVECHSHVIRLSAHARTVGRC